MSKGIHVSTLVGLVIAVIILILFSPILIKAAVLFGTRFFKL